jgi:dTDP-4-amino-4,6-dideoxygalactose transaminase
MVHLFGQQGNTCHECEGLIEVFKAKFTDEFLVSFMPHTKRGFYKNTKSCCDLFFGGLTTFAFTYYLFAGMSEIKKIPFSPPRVDALTIAAVTEVLQSGWITTGPKTAQLERGISAITGDLEVLCLNSWTNACELVLRWFGVGPGDEVIVPAYTYAATANIVIHTGATPVLVDTAPDACLTSAARIAAAISERTKVIMPVDVGGLPVDYDSIFEVIHAARGHFQPRTPEQAQLGRVLFLADAAHSFGARYKGRHVGEQADITGYSFHAVKNLTTAEGGALVFNLPAPFDNTAVRAALRRSSLHGQTKDALAKTVTGGWRYDIVEAGYKCNLTDIHAAIGCVELERYNETLQVREAICKRYNTHLANDPRFTLPTLRTEDAVSAYHLYQLRINGFTETQRDDLIDALAALGISTNVHFQPLPLLSFYKNMGFAMADYPHAFDYYANEISLPVWYGLSDDDIDTVCEALKRLVPKP